MKVFVILLATVTSAACSILPSVKPSWQETGIIGEAQGLVTSEDVQKNRAMARPASREGEPHLVWLCLPVEKLDFFCHDLGWVDDLGGPGYYSGFSVISGGNEYSFMERKFSDRGICVEDKRDLSKLIKNDTACFSAFFVGESPSDDPPLKISSLWNIERIKTRRGEWSYEKGLISLTK